MIIAIEGISGSGKSTLINGLMVAGFTRVSELSDRFDSRKEFPVFTTETTAVIESDRWFLNQEEQRHSEAKKLGCRVALDRSYQSISSHVFARARLYNTRDEDWLQEEITRRLNAGTLLDCPTFWIDVPVSVALKRLAARYYNNIEHMAFLQMTPEFLTLQAQYYVEHLDPANRIDGMQPKGLCLENFIYRLG